MYKILIVDDDVTVRKYLRSAISWLELGFELIDDAMDGMDALDKIKIYDPDIVILDLTMPVMSGIELLNNLSIKGMKCKVIILSCHDDYDNVISAMKNGAVDFLLKHRMKESDLINVLNQAVERIKKENNEVEEITQLKKNADITRHVMRKNFINEIIEGNMKEPESIVKCFEDFKPGFRLKNFVVCVIGIDGVKNLKEKYEKSLNESIIMHFQNYLYEVESKKDNCLCAGDDNGLYYIIVSYEAAFGYLAANKDVYDFLSKIMADSKEKMKTPITIGVSDICSNVSEIRSFINHAQYAYNSSFYKGKEKVIHYNEIQRSGHRSFKSLKEYENMLKDSILTKISDIPYILNSMYSEIERENASLDFVKDFNIDIISYFKKMLSEFGIDSEEIYGDGCFPYKYINMLETIDELKAWLSEIIKRIAEAIGRKNEKNKHKDIIKRAIDYIEENYMNEISLDDVARHVNLSKAYFSGFFKKETNENLIEYITRFRIERARELLENTDLKVYNVALDVGMDNYRYFTKRFKEITGLTPVEYKSIKKNNGT